jgi:hypothetical protein
MIADCLIRSHAAQQAGAFPRVERNTPILRPPATNVTAATPRDILCWCGGASMLCPKMASCALFPVFSTKSFLKVWQMNYCEADYSRCARFKAVNNGVVVSPTLLPNGKHLPVITGPGNSK